MLRKLDRGRIRSLRQAGLSAGDVARVVRAKVSEVESVLAEVSQDPSSPVGSSTVPVQVPEGAARGPPTADDQSRGLESPSPDDDPPLYRQGQPGWPKPERSDLGRLLEGQIGRLTKNPGLAAFITDDWEQLPPDDFDGLEQIITGTGADPKIGHAVRMWLERRTRDPSFMEDGPRSKKDEHDDSPRAKLKQVRRDRVEALEIRMLEAETLRMEREARGVQPPAAHVGGSTDPQTKERLDRLESMIGQYQLKEAVRQATAPLEAENRELKEHISHSKDGALDPVQIELETLRRASLRKDQAQGDVLSEAAATLHERPHLVRDVAAKHEAQVGRLLTRLEDRFLGPDELASATPDAPTPDELRRAAAQLEALDNETSPTAESTGRARMLPRAPIGSEAGVELR
jgi:hypothetical protein